MGSQEKRKETDGEHRTHQRQVAVITGASSGLGAATARALARHGYNLALLVRGVDRINALATELGGGTIALAADVTDRDSLVAAAEQVQTELGGADVLINNAGLMLLGPFSSQQTLHIIAPSQPVNGAKERLFVSRRSKFQVFPPSPANVLVRGSSGP